ncbi:cap-specific mRNA (nucleoside-2'-O-)-methyltransferase 2 [Pectinophora gossypiella]|uniref:cap-specific mRNA (nucleoside-2'-O-)-methyltransferase 2 n=1 Tax=Pectinophora gossypiella TaxID=13191 RepID=UPI00214E539D|nr:cap-specific mRNA (nucleoside-2'-O-)-methyltransferase 2 [Pectinophora gossypiella]
MFHKSEGCFLQSRHGYSRHDEFDELNDLFNKKFQFRFSEEWELPSADSWFSAPPWKVKELETLKTRLNFYKSQLNDFNIEEWSSHTRRRNPAGEVCWKIRCLVNPEFLTQAWTKFYECASTYNAVPMEAIIERKMVSLHLCEAPGAFITSLNHYLKSNYPDVEWKWIANTLNPYYEGNSPSNMISDDRFMFHTLNNWDFGADNTGNLMDWNNSQAIVNKAKSLGKVLLVTADGSIDCLQKPDAQEEVTSLLHYCEIVTALQALSPGGTFIFKLFTMFEHSTVSLLYLINHLFEEVNIYKPVTSRQGNSEVYAVCLKYKGSDGLTPFISRLEVAFGTELYETLALFPLEAIPESFLKQVQDCAFYFSSIQCQVINNNLQAYLMQNNPALYRDIKKIRAIVASEFIWKYNLRPLEMEDEILKGILHEENKINTNPRYHRGSYTERELYTKMNLKEKSKSLSSFLEAEVLSNPMMSTTEQTKWINHDENLKINPILTLGKPLKKIGSSKFIFVPIFKLYQQILAEKEFREIIFGKDETIETQNTPELVNKTSCNGNKELYLSEFVHKEDYSVYEKRCFKQLLQLLNSLSIGDSLMIRNFSTLTHFNNSVLFILSKKCFASTGLTCYGSIILNNLLTKEPFKYLDDIATECDKVMGDDSKDVLNTLPVQVTNTGEFFNNIVFFNNTFYRNKCTEYLKSIQMSL